MVARKSLRYVDTGYRRARVEVRYYAEVPGPKIPAAGDCFLAPSKRNREVLAQNGYLERDEFRFDHIRHLRSSLRTRPA